MMSRVSDRRAPTPFALLALALVTTAEPQVVATGERGGLQGEIRIESGPSRRLTTPGAYPGRSVRVAARHDTSEVENVVVFVRRSAPMVPAPMRAVMRQEGEAFVPHTLAISTGSVVEFPNADPFFHNVFSLSGGATFDLGRFRRGQSRERTFAKAGIVKVYCHLHAHMSGVIRVFDHPYFALPDRTGRFAIGDLEPGQHDVVAWHERVGEVVRRVTILGGKTSTLSFSLPMVEPK